MNRYYVLILVSGVISSCDELELSREDQVIDYVEEHPMDCFGGDLFQACAVDSLGLRLGESWRYDRSQARVECMFQEKELLDCECLRPDAWSNLGAERGELEWMSLEECVDDNSGT